MKQRFASLREVTAEAAFELETASTGIPELDRTLERLNWGDNVVWEIEEGASVLPFNRSIAALAPSYDSAAYVSLVRTRAEVAQVYPELDVIDATPSSSLAQAGPLLAAVREISRRGRRALLIFDPLETMIDRWGIETAGRFFTRGCPLLLELGAIAYWSFTPTSHPVRLRRAIEGITQCVIAVGGSRLRIAKAEGRPAGVQGSVFRYRVADGTPVLSPAPAVARLGDALRALRIQRGMSQSELARLAGVSPSAISQAERGQRGLSLETLLELTGKLGMTLDELLRGELAPGYRLARRHDPHGSAEGTPLPLFDNPLTGLRASLVRLAPQESSAVALPHRGVELVAVGAGLVQVALDTGRPVLRSGEALLVEGSTVTGFRNLGDREATIFRVLRDRLPQA